MAGVVLTGVLVALATLQYRWLGEVSEAERGRMRESLRVRAADFTQDFDRELTRIYLAFHFESGCARSDSGPSIGAAALDKAWASAAGPGLIKDVFLLEAQGPRANVLQRFDAATRTLQPVEWPEAIAAWRGRTIHAAPPGVAGTLPIFMADANRRRRPRADHSGAVRQEDRRRRRASRGAAESGGGGARDHRLARRRSAAAACCSSR